MRPLSERLAHFIETARTSPPSEAEVGALSAELSTLSLSETKDVAVTFTTAHYNHPDLFKKAGVANVFASYQARAKTLINEEAGGIYKGPMARFEAAKYIVMKRETQGLMPADLPSDEQIQARIDSIVSRASANAATNRTASQDARFYEPFAKSILGLNGGPDQITEVNVELEDKREACISAYDRAGFRVMYFKLDHDRDSKTVDLTMYVSHGRDCTGVAPSQWSESTPGRGNPMLVCAMLEGAVESALYAGFSQLKTHNASDADYGISKKLGFVEDADSKSGTQLERRLDLTNPESVRKLVGALEASKAFYAALYGDVPKDVTERLVADGVPLNPGRRNLQTLSADKKSQKLSFVLDVPVSEDGKV